MRVQGLGGWALVLAASVAALPFGCSESPVSGTGAGAAPGSGGRGSAGRGSGGTGGSVGGTSGTSTGGNGGASGSSPQVGGKGGSSAGTTGDAGMSGEDPGGAGGTGGSTSEGGEAGMGGASACEALVAHATQDEATVTLLVDNSSSMFESMPPAWTPLYQALMHPTTGVVKALENRIRFGFAAYRGSATSHAEDDAACADWTTVPAGIDNHATIDAAYGPIAWPIDHPKWETPSGHAIRKATADLVADSAPGQKIILFITDGNPNTCQVLDPVCGQDNSIRATQDAHAAGVRLIAVGAGDIIAQPNNGCSVSSRCGPLHLQDLANAGAGFPVKPPPGCEDPTSAGCQYKYESCIQGQVLQAAYTSGAPDAAAPLLLDTASSPTPESLSAVITGALDDLVSCTVELDVNVTGDVTRSTVVVGGSALTLNGSPGGFTLDIPSHTLTLTGTACAAFRTGADLSVSFGCDPDTGMPVASPR